MFGIGHKKVVCAVIGATCPETSNPDSALAKKAGRYCNFWADAIPETHTDSSGRFTQEIYKGCVIPKLVPYLVSIASQANHAGASADKSATEAHKASVAANLTTLALKHVGIAIEAQSVQQLIPPDDNRLIGIEGENHGSTGKN